MNIPFIGHHVIIVLEIIATAPSPHADGLRVGKEAADGGGFYSLRNLSFLFKNSGTTPS